MAIEPPKINWRGYVGRFSLEFEVTDHGDAVMAEEGFLLKDHPRRARISGVVDTRVTRPMLSASVVTKLGLLEAGEAKVGYADGRRESKAKVRDVELEIQGRSSVFTAVVEPGRTNALIGAIVLEELDFVADCTQQVLLPLDTHWVFDDMD
jgi:predicted aspartyl protease